MNITFPKFICFIALLSIQFSISSLAFEIGDRIIYLPSPNNTSLTRIPGKIINLSPNIIVKLDTGIDITVNGNQLGNPKDYSEVNIAENKLIESMLQNDMSRLPDFLYSRLESSQINQNDNKTLPIGELIDMGGYRFNLLCMGQEKKGIPTVILETGSGDPGISWILVQREIAKFSRVCSYDRGGYGWSDLRPLPRDPKFKLQFFSKFPAFFI